MKLRRLLNLAFLIALPLAPLHSAPLAEPLAAINSDPEAPLAVAEAWRGDAVKLAAAPDATVDADADQLVRGALLKVPDRDLADEFLAQLDSARLRRLFDEFSEPSETLREHSDAVARLKVAEAVIARSELTAQSGEATREALLMTYVMDGNNLSHTIKRADSSLARKELVGNPRSEITSILAAANGPEKSEDFAWTMKLIDLAQDYQVRNPTNRIASAANYQARERGPQWLDPANFKGDDLPLRAAARSAAYIGDYQNLGSIMKWADTATNLSDDCRAEITARAVNMALFNKDYVSAAEMCKRVIDSPATGFFARNCALKLGTTYQMEGRPMDAAIAFLDAKERFAANTDFAAQAQKMMDFVIEANLLDHNAVVATAKIRRASNDTALTTGEHN